MASIILTHPDTDGICAAAIVYSAYPDAEIILFTTPVGLLDELQYAKDFQDTTPLMQQLLNQWDK